MRRIIKQFFLNIKEYQQIFQKSNSYFQFFIFSFTDNKSIQLSLTFFKHVKNNFASLNDISIVWLILFDIFQNLTKKTMTEFSSIEHISKQQFSNFDLISEQMQALSNIIIAIVNIKINRLNNKLRQLLQSTIFSQQSSVIIEQRIDVKERSTKDWTAKKVEFFDSTTDDFEFVINLKKHVFYRNVYAFVNKLKNVSFIRKKKNFLSSYFNVFEISLSFDTRQNFRISKKKFIETCSCKIDTTCWSKDLKNVSRWL